MKRFIGVGLFFIMLGCAALANADTLTLNGTVNLGNGQTGTYIYESGANITWYYVTTAGNLQSGTWTAATSWASGLTVGNTSAGTWHLPSTPGAAPFNTATSEGQLGNLYYTVLGNTAGSYTNAGLFSTANLGNAAGQGGQQGDIWTSYQDGSGHIYVYSFGGNNGVSAGYEVWTPNTTDIRGELAVHAGDIAPVPIPAAVLLFGPGLAGLAFMRRMRRHG